MIGFSYLTGWKRFTRILPLLQRNGTAQVTHAPRQAQTAVQLTTTVQGSSAGIRMTILVEQNDGASWFTMGGFDIEDVSTALVGAKMIHLLQEQTYRQDRPQSAQWPTVHSYDFNGQVYKQLALCSTLRVTFWTSAPLTYAVDLAIDSRRLKALF